jgi:hypothetical protein
MLPPMLPELPAVLGRLELDRLLVSSPHRRGGYMEVVQSHVVIIPSQLEHFPSGPRPRRTASEDSDANRHQA